MQLISIHCCIHLQMQRPEVGINFIPLYRKAYRHTHSISNYHCTHYSLLLQALCNLYNKAKTIRCASDPRLLEVDGEPLVPARRRRLQPRSTAGSSTDAAPLLRHPLHLRERGTPARQQPNFSQRCTLHRSPPRARTRQASETGADTQRTSSKRRSARRPRGCWRGAWATTAGRERRRHEQEDVAVDEAVDGKGRSAGEARSAATHAIWAVSLPSGVSGELLDMSCGFKQNRARDKN